MAIIAYPFDGEDTTEAQYSALAREFAGSGVVGSFGGEDFAVSASGTGMGLLIQPGRALMRGHLLDSTDVEERNLGDADGMTRIDRVILRIDPVTNTGEMVVLQGTPGEGPPSLSRTDSGVWEEALARVTVPPGTVLITPAMITDERRFVDHRLGTWTTATRPDLPRVGQLGHNVTLGAWEWWDGEAWVPLGAAVPWESVTGKPATYPPSEHSHSWGDITGKPASFTPASHSHLWDEIVDKPSSFPPSSHTHSASNITSGTISYSRLPVGTGSSQVARGDHSHPAPSTVSWANGSRRPRNNTPSGSATWYAVWVDGNDRFCRNTSSSRYKENIRDARLDPFAVLGIRPRVYDRKEVDGEPGPTDEFGLIAEEVAEVLPEIVVYEDGRPETVRYDLLAVAMVPLLQAQQERIEALEARLAALEGDS